MFLSEQISVIQLWKQKEYVVLQMCATPKFISNTFVEFHILNICRVGFVCIHSDLPNSRTKGKRFTK